MLKGGVLVVACWEVGASGRLGGGVLVVVCASGGVLGTDWVVVCAARGQPRGLAGAHCRLLLLLQRT